MAAGPAGRRPLGRLEQQVFDAVAAGLDDGVTAADVVATLDPTPAHTTVVSTLARLLSRRVVARHRVGRTVRYTAVGDSGVVVATSTAQRMLRLLAAAPDRSGALAQFVAELNPDDEATLGRLLAAHPGPPAGRPRPPNPTRRPRRPEGDLPGVDRVEQDQPGHLETDDAVNPAR